LGSLPPRALADWYARAAIYALPARYEPFGLTALEAGLSGCALVLGDIASLREVWGDAALYVAPDDLDGLRGVLNELIADSSLRQEFGARAVKRAGEFSMERFVRGYRALYRELVEGSRLRVERRSIPTDSSEVRI
jgi:glycosyltransferase involved in cell wall biosynthesis